jgi:hypothetical protein
MATAVPDVPFTEAGGVAWPDALSPQHTTAPLSAWIAQLCTKPTAIALAVPKLPSTDGGGDA